MSLLRATSFVVALGVSGVLLIAPRVVASPHMHLALPLLLAGVSGAFAFGLGYRPSSIGSRVLFHPATIACLLTLGLVATIAFRP